MTVPAILLDAVSRRFPARRRARAEEILALDRVSLMVPAGGVSGLLGPNGAGKTTLLRLIGTVLVPSAGRLEVLGFDTVRQPEEVRRRVGAVLGGERAVYWRLTGRENLLYAGALYGLPPRTSAERAEELLQMVELTERADDLVERYSTGMRQRLALARALMHAPPLLLLDEPTAGLDPYAAVAMRGLLATLSRDRARTIVVATHHLGEAERLCERVILLDRGRVVAFDTPDALKAHHAGATGTEPSLEAAFLALTGGPPAAAGRLP